MINKKSNGQALSSGFVTAVQGTSRQFDAQLMINNSALDCDIEYIRCYKGSCGSELAVGSVYASYIEGSLRRCATDLNTKVITYNVGLKVNGAFEYLTMGTFTVIEAKESNGSVTFTAVSTLSMKGNLDYSTSLTYPTAINNVISELSTALGTTISLKGLVGTGTIEKPLTGLIRDVLGTIGCLLGGFVTEDNTGNIVISKYNVGETASIEPYRSIFLPEFSAPYLITGIQINVDDETEYVYGTPVIIQECEWMTQALFNTMKNNIVGLQFDLAEVQIALGDPRIEPWDILGVTDLKDVSHNVPCFEIVHTFNGGFETEVTAQVDTAEMSDTNVRGALSKVVERLDADVLAAAVAATQAKAQAQTAAEAAQDAQDSADEATRQAGIATGNANEAIRQAGLATASANEAIRQADIATTNADEAKEQAHTATVYANSALDQLGIVQDVIGVLNWATEHGSFILTADTTVQEGKVYFAYDQETEDYTPVVAPSGDPSSDGYYELTVDEAMESFIMSHLAVTARGLWILPNGYGASSDAQTAPDYKVLLAPDGLYVYDEDGLLVATYGESISFSSTRAQTIGNSNAGISFDPSGNGSITITGAEIDLVGGPLRNQIDAIESGTTANTNSISSMAADVNEVSNALDGATYYQYTDNGTTYDVWSETDGSTVNYYYYDSDGVKTAVAYEDLDEEAGEKVTVYKTGLIANFDAYRSSTTSDIEELQSSMTNYDQFIRITPNPASILLGERDGDTLKSGVEITTSNVNFTVDGITTAYASGQTFNAPEGSFENISMKTTTGEGDLRWIARSNGHLSLKVVK